LQNKGIVGGSNQKTEGVKFDFLIFSAKPLGLVFQPFGDEENVAGRKVKCLVFAADYSIALRQVAKVMTGDRSLAAIREVIIGKSENIK